MAPGTTFSIAARWSADRAVSTAARAFTRSAERMPVALNDASVPSGSFTAISVASDSLPKDASTFLMPCLSAGTCHSALMMFSPTLS